MTTRLFLRAPRRRAQPLLAVNRSDIPRTPLFEPTAARRGRGAAGRSNRAVLQGAGMLFCVTRRSLTAAERCETEGKQAADPVGPAAQVSINPTP
jgi:hypothetical protein